VIFVLVSILIAGAAVPAVRVGDAAHGVLRKRRGNCAEAKEGRERKCEREFHDPSPLVQGIATGDGHAALRNKLLSRALRYLIARNGKF
jgi:hypothetical protein